MSAMMAGASRRRDMKRLPASDEPQGRRCIANTVGLAARRSPRLLLLFEQLRDRLDDVRPGLGGDLAGAEREVRDDLLLHEQQHGHVGVLAEAVSGRAV